MADKRKLLGRVQAEPKTEEVLHSSGFARAQSRHYSSGGGPVERAFSDQKAADARRRYVRGYENARLVQGAYTAERARKYVPRTKRDTSGDGFAGSLARRPR